MRHASGFTVMEFLLTISMVALLGGFTAILSTKAIANAEFDRVRELVRSELVAAQTDTIAGTFDMAWGVAFTSSTITRYGGSSYATRNTTYDRVTSLNSVVTLSGTSDIPFIRPTGAPFTAATIVITNGTLSSTTTVTGAGGIDIQ